MRYSRLIAQLRADSIQSISVWLVPTNPLKTIAFAAALTSPRESLSVTAATPARSKVVAARDITTTSVDVVVNRQTVIESDAVFSMETL